MTQKTVFSVLAVYALFACLVASTTMVRAAEGGYSNYIPGTYGDFAMAVEPETKLTIRSDSYYYGADTRRAVLSGPSPGRRGPGVHGELHHGSLQAESPVSWGPVCVRGVRAPSCVPTLLIRRPFRFGLKFSPRKRVRVRISAPAPIQ